MIICDFDMILDDCDWSDSSLFAYFWYSIVHYMIWGGSYGIFRDLVGPCGILLHNLGYIMGMLCDLNGCYVLLYDFIRCYMFLLAAIWLYLIGIGWISFGFTGPSWFLFDIILFLLGFYMIVLHFMWFILC